MSIETWREKYAHLLEEVTLKSKYSDEAESGDYKRLARTISKDDFGKNGKGGFWSRPQIRRNEAPRTVSRTVPLWFFNDDAVRQFLRIQFSIKPSAEEHDRDRSSCGCYECRRSRTAHLWHFIIHRLRMNEPAEKIAREWAPQKTKKKSTIKPIKPDVTNEDPSYWEEVLKSHMVENNDDDDDDDDIGYSVLVDGTTIISFDYECPDGRSITAADVRRILEQIRDVAAGLRTDGKPRKKWKPLETTVL